MITKDDIRENSRRFGRRLRYLRRKRGLTRVELAHAAGLQPGRLRRLEDFGDWTFISNDQAIAIARGLTLATGSAAKTMRYLHGFERSADGPWSAEMARAVAS